MGYNWMKSVWINIDYRIFYDDDVYCVYDRASVDKLGLDRSVCLFCSEYLAECLSFIQENIEI